MRNEHTEEHLNSKDPIMVMAPGRALVHVESFLLTLWHRNL